MVLSILDNRFNEEQLAKSKKNGINNSSDIVNYYKKNYSNVRTLTNKVSLTRKYLEKNGYDKKFLNNIYPGKEITKEAIKQNEEKLESTTITRIKKSFVDEIIKNGPSETKYPALAVYLLLASGRRLQEIISGKYIVDPENKNNVLIDTLLKKRTKGNEYTESVRIIGGRDSFLSAMSLFKKLINKVALTTMKHNIQKHIKLKYSRDGIPTSHFFRVLYANYLFTYHNPKNLIYNVYIKNALNHLSLTPSINYTSIKVID
jgi:hypothetical protein